MKKENGPGLLIGAVHLDELDAGQIMPTHRSSGHPEVRRTTYFARRVCPAGTKAGIISGKLIQTCEECQSIILALIHWEKVNLETNRNYQKFGMDIMHHGSRHFLTLTAVSRVLDLESVGKTRLGNHDSTAEDGGL